MVFETVDGNTIEGKSALDIVEGLRGFAFDAGPSVEAYMDAMTARLRAVHGVEVVPGGTRDERAARIVDAAVLAGLLFVPT